MGKCRNKNKDKDPYAGPTRSGRKGSDSDDSYSDGMSIDDDMTSVRGDIDDVDDVFDKLVENLENAQHKNLSIRTAALSALIYALTSQYSPEFIDKNKETLVTLCTKIDNKTSEECNLLANLISVVAIQAGEDISEMIDVPMAQIRTVLMDPAKSDGVRISCASALAIVSRMSCSDDEIISANVKACRFAWTTVKSNSNHSNLFTSALRAWCILLLDSDHQTISSAVADQPKLVQYLSSEHLETRIAAGESLAFLYEFMDETKPGFKFPNHQHVLEILEDMVGETSKRKTKKEKRIQRFTFRDIYTFMSGEDDAPAMKVKFGAESLMLDTCSIKLFYDICCEVLRGGMMRQLQKNEVLRQVFSLGDVRLDSDIAGSKSARMAVHDAADKYRNQVRGRQRDKRNVVL